MPAPKKPVKEKEERMAKPADNPVSREKQMVNLAVELAEKQLRDGTASAAVMTHFLKIGSTREVIERDILEKQAEFLAAKASSIAQGKDAERLAREAIDAMKNYNSGSN